MTDSNIAIAKLAQLQTLEQELKEKKKALRLGQARQTWETETKAHNPQYVMGSLRPSVQTDEDILSHTHGWVCLIKCESCDEIRLVNKQDAKQCRFCKACKTTASKVAAKAKRLTKKLGTVSQEDMEAQIAELDEQLADLS